MSKTIEIKKVYLRNLFLSFLIGFCILYGLEHFGTFSYIPECSSEKYDSDGRLKTYIEIPNTSNVLLIKYSTFFKNEIETKGNGFQIIDFLISDSDFDKYSVKSYYYTQAMLKDFKEGVLISFGLFLVSLLLTIFKFKLV